MKKSNPLKTFNDNYDSRVNKITQGNNKLIKAQVGIVKLPPSLERMGNTISQGPLDKDASTYLNTLYPSTSGKNESPIAKDTKGSAAGTKEMYNRALLENQLRRAKQSTTDYMTGSSKKDMPVAKSKAKMAKGGSVNYKKK
jgi:hypothetical protein